MKIRGSLLPHFALPIGMLFAIVIFAVRTFSQVPPLPPPPTAPGGPPVFCADDVDCDGSEDQPPEGIPPVNPPPPPEPHPDADPPQEASGGPRSGGVINSDGDPDAYDPNDPVEPDLADLSVVLGNYLVSPDATQDPYGYPQNEPTISLSPMDSFVFAASANDYLRGTATGVGQKHFGANGTFVSTTGGVSWTPTTLPGANQPPEDIRGSDGVVVHARTYPEAYYVGLSFFGLCDTATRVFFKKSNPDGGQTWGSATTVLASEPVGAQFALDKPWLAVAPNDDLVAAYGLCHVPEPCGIGQLDFACPQFDVYARRSADRGASFSAPVKINDNAPVRANGVQVAFDSGSNQYAAWLQYPPDDTSDDGFIVFDYAPAGTMSYGTDQYVASVETVPRHFTGARFRVTSLPALAVDPRPGVQRAYIVWTDDVNRESGESDDGGDGDNVQRRAEIYVATVSRNGADWAFSPKKRILDENVPFVEMKFDQFMPAATVDSAGTLHVLFYSRIDKDTPRCNVWHTTSVDGQTFLTPTKVNTGSNISGGVQNDGRFMGDYIGITTRTDATTGQIKAYAVWTDTRQKRPNRTTKQQDIFLGIVQ